MRSLILAALIAPGCFAAAAGNVAAPPKESGAATSSEPTPEETQILELMNRFRADPGAEAERIVADKAGGGWVFKGVDVQMFLSECKALKPAPPLVMNLALLASARNHSTYMIHNGLGHVEEPGKQGFTGQSFVDRAKAAGYRGGPGGENCFRDAGSPWHSQMGFVVDTGPGGTGGMQPGRGHRVNMANGRFREVGCSAVPHGGRLSVTHNFGGGSAGRYCGGVVFVDLNRNGAYDIGEGRGGVTVAGSDGSKTQTWSSGAYTLELKSAGDIQIQAELDGRAHKQSFAAGKDNVKFDWVIPQQADLDACDKLVADVEKAGAAESTTRTRALVALWLGTRQLALDAPRAAKVQELGGATGTKLEASQAAVRGAMDGDAGAFRKIVDEESKAWRGTTAELWFRSAQVAVAAGHKVEELLKAGKPQPRTARDMVKQLEAARDQVHGDFRGRFDAMLGKVRPHAE